MSITHIQQKISLVARRARGPIFDTNLSLVARRAGDPIDGNALKTRERQASYPIDSNIQRLVERRDGGPLNKDTVSLLIWRILRPVTCKSVKKPTSTHWLEVTGWEERKLLSSGSLLEVSVSGWRYSASREPQLNTKGRTAKGIYPTFQPNFAGYLSDLLCSYVETILPQI